MIIRMPSRALKPKKSTMNKLVNTKQKGFLPCLYKPLDNKIDVQFI